MFRRKLVAVLAAALVFTGSMSPVASAQSERVVPPEERDAYVTEFQYNAATPSVVDGVGGLTDEEVAEIQETIRQAEASGPPQDEIIPGEMWSDKVGVPEGFDKAEADQSEVAIAKETSQSQARGFQTTAERCRSFWLIPYKVCGEILIATSSWAGKTVGSCFLLSTRRAIRTGKATGSDSSAVLSISIPIPERMQSLR